MKLSRKRKLAYILSWIPYMLVKFVLSLIGLVVLSIVIPLFGKQSLDWPRLFWVWGNDEEEYPDWWKKAAKKENWFIKRFPCWWWYAMRNPVNNTRYWFKEREAAYSGNWATHDMEAQDLYRAGIREAHRWAYNGWFAGYRWVRIDRAPGLIYAEDPGQYSEWWIGWKVGSKVPGLGFTFQRAKERDFTV